MSKRVRVRKRERQRRHREHEEELRAKVGMFRDIALRTTAQAMLRADPFAEDYLRQAPIIVYGFYLKRGFLSWWGSNGAVTTGFREMLARSRRLRDIMAELGLPWPLRKLEAEIIGSSALAIISMFVEAQPSTLGRVLSRGAEHQRRLRHALHPCYELRYLRGRRVPELSDWFVGGASDRLTCGHSILIQSETREIVDFLIHGGVVDVRWSWADALAAVRRWHSELATERARREAAETREVADYGALPLRLVVDGFEFVALRTRLDLYDEGKELAHCVASYWPKLRDGSSRIYGIRQDGRRLATMEIGPTLAQELYGDATFFLVGKEMTRKAIDARPALEIRQIQGYDNTRPPEAVRIAAAKAFGLMVPLTAQQMVDQARRLGLHLGSHGEHAIVGSGRLADPVEAALMLIPYRAEIAPELRATLPEGLRGPGPFDEPLHRLQEMDGRVDLRARR